MSKIARWSYKNTARVRPFVTRDTWGGGITYGPEYTIKCNWIAEGKQQIDAEGREFISAHVIYTEDLRPKYLDLILLNGREDWEEIRSRTEWEMAMFGDDPDIKLVT